MITCDGVYFFVDVLKAQWISANADAISIDYQLAIKF